jgi:hypothetical protein
MTVHLEPKHAAEYILYNSSIYIYLMGVFCRRLTSITFKHETQVSDQTFCLPSYTCILARPVLEVTAFADFFQ